MSCRGITRAVALTAACLATLGSLAAGASAAGSPLPVALGTVSSFAVMGATTVTSAGVSTVTGNLGVSPGTAVTGFPLGILVGTLHAGDAVAAQAHADLGTAYADAAGRSPGGPITGDLGGVTLTPGVYDAGAGMSLAAGSTLTLNGQGNPSAVFILQAGSTLITGANSNVMLTGGAQACNVFWAVGSSATLGASSLLAGSIIASTSISMGSGATVQGRALADTGAVTLISDVVTVSQCAGSLSNTAPAITPFSAKLTGLNQSVSTTVGAWSVNDQRGSNAGYSITVAASAPTVNGSTSAAGTGGSLMLAPSVGTAAKGNLATVGPVASSVQTLSPTPTTIENARAGTGQGEWDFAADSGATTSLTMIIPGDARAGSYSSTLTYTSAPPAA